jgi:hypothetical protein
MAWYFKQSVHPLLGVSFAVAGRACGVCIFEIRNPKHENRNKSPSFRICLGFGYGQVLANVATAPWSSGLGSTWSRPCRPCSAPGTVFGVRTRASVLEW